MFGDYRFLLFISVLCNVAGIQVLVNLSHDQAFMICTVIGILMMLTGASLVVPMFGVIVAAYVLLAVEFLVSALVIGCALYSVRRLP